MVSYFALNSTRVEELRIDRSRSFQSLSVAGKKKIQKSIVVKNALESFCYLHLDLLY